MTERRGASEKPEKSPVETAEESKVDRERRGANTPAEPVERAVVNPPETRGGARA